MRCGGMTCRLSVVQSSVAAGLNCELAHNLLARAGASTGRVRAKVRNPQKSSVSEENAANNLSCKPGHAAGV